jgi:hypothetical protein
MSTQKKGNPDLRVVFRETDSFFNGVRVFFIDKMKKMSANNVTKK